LQAPGDLKIIPAGFSRIWQIEGPARKLTINITRPLIEMAADALGINVHRISIEPRLHLRDPKIEHIGWALKCELESAEPVGRVYAESLGLALASHLIRPYAPLAARPIEKGLANRRLRRVMDYIHDHLADDLSLVELAEIADVSRSHFNVLFKHAMGLSVHQYVIRSRVERAVSLLLNDTLSVAGVALETGFANQAHMANCMRRVAGVTPGYLRRNAV